MWGAVGWEWIYKLGRFWWEWIDKWDRVGWEWIDRWGRLGEECLHDEYAQNMNDNGDKGVGAN